MNTKIFTAILTASFLLGAPAMSFAAATKTPACHDAKGKFTKCLVPTKKAPCHDSKGKFTKCPV